MENILESYLDYLNEDKKKKKSFWSGVAGVQAALEVKKSIRNPKDMLFSTLTIGAIYRAIRAAVDKCSRKCYPFGPNFYKRQSCMIACREDAIRNSLNKLDEGIVSCGDDKHCKEKLKDAKYHLEKKLKKLEEYKSEFSPSQFNPGKEHFESQKE